MNHPYGKNGVLSDFGDGQNLDNFDHYQIQGIFAPSRKIEPRGRGLDTRMGIQCSSVVITVQRQTIFSATELRGVTGWCTAFGTRCPETDDCYSEILRTLNNGEDCHSKNQKTQMRRKTRTAFIGGKFRF